MLSSQIKELNKAKAKVARLESKIARSLTSELSGLPTRFGFPDLKPSLLP